MQLIPTAAGRRALDGLGLLWADAVRLVDTAERDQPMVGMDGRRCLASGDYFLYVADGQYDGEPARFLLGGKRREAEAPSELRTFVERKAKKSGKKGGAGRLLPTSFEEILGRIDDADGWYWERSGRKHIAVFGPEGQRGTIPNSASDHRSLANNVGHLRKLGLDVRRDCAS